MNNFFQRSITGAVFVVVLLGAIYFGPYSFILLFSIITFLGLFEFYSLASQITSQPQKISGTIIGTVFFILTSLISAHIIALSNIVFFIPLVFVPFIIELYGKRENPFGNIAITLFGNIYIAVPMSLLAIASFQNGNYSYHILIGFFLILWTSDTGAYITGSLLGRHKLFERISPGKTWEGSIGGFLFAMIVAFMISRYFLELSLTDWLIVAMIIVVFGTLGDLIESMFKRSIGVKDSGTILPGHGGIIDRFDALFLAAPFVYAFLALKEYF